MDRIQVILDESEAAKLSEQTAVNMTKLDDGDYNFENLELIKVE